MNQLNNTTLLNVYILCWKDTNGIYFPNGNSAMINANHQKEGTYGVSIKGEVFALPNTVLVPPASPPTNDTDWQQQTALVNAGAEYTAPYPTATNGDQVKICVKVKDLSTMVTYYLDAADYAAQVAKFNPVPYSS